jgi:hypothetical protein
MEVVVEAIPLCYDVISDFVFFASPLSSTVALSSLTDNIGS